MSGDLRCFLRNAGPGRGRKQLLNCGWRSDDDFSGVLEPPPRTAVVAKAFDRQDISRQFPGRVEDHFTDSFPVSHTPLAADNVADSSLVSHTPLAADTESLHRFISLISYPIPNHCLRQRLVIINYHGLVTITMASSSHFKLKWLLLKMATSSHFK